jgi:glycosyltransferase involved in cell wall biosynthesis
MKVLISAYACEPHRGSEPGAGWNLAREIAKYHETWVLTSHEHEGAIREELAKNPVPALQFVFVDPGRWTLTRSKRNKPIPWRDYVHSYAWQAAAYFQGKVLHRREHFEIVHHVTYARYYTPSFLALLPVPFFWGPVGGGESAPPAFWRDFGWRGCAYESLRNLARWSGELDPFVRMTARHSALARATTGETAIRLRKIGAGNVDVFPQVGLAEAEIRSISEKAGSIRSDAGHRTFLSVSRLVHWKGLHLGLRAFALARPPGTEYWIVGDGPEKHRLEALTSRLGVTDRVRFLGRLSRDEVIEVLGGCMAVVHPSLHDSGGVVCLEAMAAAKPVICLNIGGPATQVTTETGFLIPPTTPDEVVRGIAASMRQLSGDEVLRRRLGLNGYQHVHGKFSWEARGRFLSDLYGELSGGGKEATH